MQNKVKDFLTKHSLWKDILGLRYNQKEIFYKNWNLAGKKKRIVIFLSLIGIYILNMLFLVGLFCLFDPDHIPTWNNFFSYMFPALGILTIYLAIDKILTIPEVTDKTKYTSGFLSAAYLGFTIYASLCFMRLCLSLPLLFKGNKTKTLGVNLESNFDINSITRIIEFYNLNFIYTFSFKIIIAFLLFRLFLNLFNGISSLEPTLSKAKKIWNSTIVVWGVIFTVLTTVAVLWVASNG
jgi:hypothetical protein